jgi:aminoglycoside phosphotransferase
MTGSRRSRTSPAQTAREQLQGAMGALLEQLRRDAEGACDDFEEEAARLRLLEGRARVAKTLADSHRDILALQSIPDPDRADKDRKGSLGRLAAALRHAHGAPVTTRPPGEE